MAAHRTKYPYKPKKLAGKLQRLCEINYGKYGTLPVLAKGSPEWEMWRSWRKRHGLNTAFMESGKYNGWTVPMQLPPKDMAELDALIGGGKDEQWA